MTYRKIPHFKGGEQFGFYTVIEPKNPIQLCGLWLCKCKCGNERYVNKFNLIRGKAKSCGCRINHGHVGTRTYNSWGAMKKRCLNPNSEVYHNYGGRGIKICQRWIDSFYDFLADMGECPSKNHTLERIDTNGNYEPSNCKWDTYKAQGNNKRNNRFITIDGNTKTLAAWVEEYGVGYSMVFNRIKNGMNPIDALTIPSSKANCFRK